MQNSTRINSLPPEIETISTLPFFLEEVRPFTDKEMEVVQARLENSNEDPNELLLSWALLQTYGKQLLEENHGMHGSTLRTLPERLASLLLELSDHNGKVEQISHQTLANHLDTYRETVSSLLRTFKRQGLIKIGYQSIQILHVESVEELAGI